MLFPNMEIAGIKVDKENLKSLSIEFEEDIVNLQKKDFPLSRRGI